MRVSGWYKIPLRKACYKIPLKKGGKGVVKVFGKTQPPLFPFVKGDNARLNLTCNPKPERGLYEIET